jgi:oxygen-independent coproporphyrinogen III oxidase
MAEEPCHRPQTVAYFELGCFDVTTTRTTGRRLVQEPIRLETVDESQDAQPVEPFEGLQSLLGVEECVRYYPPDLATVTDSRAVFAMSQAGRPSERAHEMDIFVDVPFCKTICGFCPFNVYPYDPALARGYLDDLKMEIHRVKEVHDFGPVRAGTLWVGGGTPSVMAEEFLDELLTLLSSEFDLSHAHELTVEVKPSLGDLNDSKIALLRRHGIGRISMGVQSTQEHQLRILGRGHTREQALDVIELIRSNGFALNIDMMYRLPGQQLAEVACDIADVVARGIDHMSWFPYVPHEGTPLAKRMDRGRVQGQVGRDVYQKMFEAVGSGLTAQGYEQYTPYHFGLTDRCHYHVGRWGLPQRPTLGLGPGAFSFFNGWIYANQHDPANYHRDVVEGRPPVMCGKRLDLAESVTRLAVLGIKLFKIDFNSFRAASGQEFVDYYSQEIDLLASLRLIEVHPDHISCTAEGRAFNNDVASVFATDTARRARHPQALDYMRSKT